MKTQKKIIFLILSFILFLSLPLVLAHGEETFNQAEAIIKDNTPCNQLTNDQLEVLGDYYMEQMHPGETHETMDQMMGREGSENLKQMHINMAKSFYCGEHGAMSAGMMNMMMGRNNMMDSSIMGGGNMMFGNGMGFFNPFSWMSMGFGLIFMIIFWGLIIWLVVWLINNYLKPKKQESALETLKRRYVQGKITKKQYEKIKKEIK